MRNKEPSPRKEKIAVVVTSIAGPKQLETLARGCREHGYHFIVIGDEASPAEFELDGCDFYGLKDQRKLDLKFPSLCPTRHYARKNIGYLVAMRMGATVIIEVDDDIFPYRQFWEKPVRRQNVPVVASTGWLNVYSYFSKTKAWPRGLPLEHVNDPVPPFAELQSRNVDCPIQQNVTDLNPDVDAIYRLTRRLPLKINRSVRVALKSGTWSPFNSQSTTWWLDAFPLLYLPALCSFRMTDIWRSFVAQRNAWANNWTVLFQGASCKQERNQHNLLKDFEDEIPGYLRNSIIRDRLDELELRAGKENIFENLYVSYEVLVKAGILPKRELRLLSAWVDDVREVFAERGIDHSGVFEHSGPRAPTARQMVARGAR